MCKHPESNPDSRIVAAINSLAKHYIFVILTAILDTTLFYTHNTFRKPLHSPEEKAHTGELTTRRSYENDSEITPGTQLDSLPPATGRSYVELAGDIRSSNGNRITFVIRLRIDDAMKTD
uniref:Uncharacterized protein n=1 Tax=Helianthus annuus TaxID=4232 RepID=A0A251UNV4_HELAN